MDETRIVSLMSQAAAAAKNAYVPYSNFPVGCAILLRSGQVFLGVNIENAAYPVAICAERSALAHVVTAGLQEQIQAVAVVSNAKVLGTPCGMCRQALSEFLGNDTPIFFGDTMGNYRVTTIAQLLPEAFGRASLETAGAGLGSY